MDGYWKWLGSLGFGGMAEYACGILVLIVASPVLAATLTPWWLVVSIPAGLFLITHGIFREVR